MNEWANSSSWKFIRVTPAIEKVDSSESVRGESPVASDLDNLQSFVPGSEFIELRFLLLRLGQLQNETTPPNLAHTRSVQPFGSTGIDEVQDETINAVYSLKSIEAVAAVRDDDMQAIGKIPGRYVAVSWRRHRIPLTSENQCRHF